MRPFERQSEIIRPYRPDPGGTAQVFGLAAAAIVDRFIDDVPPINAALVMPDHRVNMVAQSLHREFARQRFRIGWRLKEPVGRLRMPCESVTPDFDVVVLAPLDNNIKVW